MSTNSFWLYLEIIVILAVISYQFYISYKIRHKINNLKHLFDKRIVVRKGYIKNNILLSDLKNENHIQFNINEDDDEDEFSKIYFTKTDGTGIIKSIKDNINYYLLNNFGASVNFSIIKDIIDREVDNLDEEISNSITTPLYLGLAATMIGIIFGLFSMPDLSNQEFSISINSLITGVKIAMFGSLTGLAATTILSSIFYKNAKSQVLKDKNEQVSYLLATLLPELVKADETGISGLRASISSFSKDTQNLVTTLYETAKITAKNLKLQEEVIAKVNKVDVTKVSKYNLELFKQFENNMGAFEKFAIYLDLMGSISENLSSFASNTNDVKTITEKISESMDTSVRLNEFLTSHFDQIERLEHAALSAVALADVNFENAVGQLTEHMNNNLNEQFANLTELSIAFNETTEQIIEESANRIQQVNNQAEQFEANINEAFNQIGANLQTSTDQHINNLNNAYRNAIPEFDNLRHLTALPEIKEQIKLRSNKSSKNVRTESNSDSKKENKNTKLPLSEVVKSLFKKQ